VDSVETNKHTLNFFSPSGSHIMLVFRTKRHGNILTRTPLTGGEGLNAGGVRRNHDFDQYLASSRVVNAATARCYQHGTAGPWQVVTLTVDYRTLGIVLFIPGMGQ